MKSINKIIEEVLSQYRFALGEDFNTYRNHVYRIFSLCINMDYNQDNEDKYAIASVFHDLGIWTNKTFDYLGPSIALAQNYLNSIDKIDWKEEVEVMIEMHHKLSKYSGEYKETVEVFRKADWIDVTRGLKLFGLNRRTFDRISKRYPSLGFHRFLMNQTIKNLFKNPLNPLPMFRK